MAKERTRYTDWYHYFYLNRGERKADVAAELGISDAAFSKLVHHERYRPSISDELAEVIAAKWNQPVGYVRRVYPKIA